MSETVEETTEETTVEYQEATEEEQTVTEQIKTVTESVSQRSVGSTGRTQRPPNERLTRPTKASAAKGKGAQETEKPPRPISAPSYESSEVCAQSTLFRAFLDLCTISARRSGPT